MSLGVVGFFDRYFALSAARGATRGEFDEKDLSAESE